MKMNWLNGKKTLIGAFLHFVVFVVKGAEASFGLVLFPADLLNLIQEIGNWFIGVGFIHKGWKTDLVQEKVLGK